MNSNFSVWLTFAFGASEYDPGGEEGGLSLDTGGDNPTWRGIQLREWREWRGDYGLTGADMKQQLRLSEISRIVRAGYWLPIRADTAPAGVDVLNADHCLNAGQGSATACIKAWQSRLCVKADGFVGPVTVLAMRGVGTAVALGMLRDCIEQDYRTKRQWAACGAGWLARLGRCYGMALKLAGAQPANS